MKCKFDQKEHAKESTYPVKFVPPGIVNAMVFMRSTKTKTVLSVPVATNTSSLIESIAKQLA